MSESIQRTVNRRCGQTSITPAQSFLVPSLSLGRHCMYKERAHTHTPVFPTMTLNNLLTSSLSSVPLEGIEGRKPINFIECQHYDLLNISFIIFESTSSTGVSLFVCNLFSPFRKHQSHSRRGKG